MCVCKVIVINSLYLYFILFLKKKKNIFISFINNSLYACVCDYWVITYINFYWVID